MTHEQGFIPVDYGSIFYTKYFTATIQDKDPLIVLHGGPGLTHDYLLPLKALAQHQPVIFYDQGGCGASVLSKPVSSWSLDFYVQELDAIINALGLQKFHLLGHSFGAAIAVSYTSKHPKKIKSLILASPWLGAQQWIDSTLMLAQKISPETRTQLVEHERAGSTNDPGYKKAQELFYAQHFCRIPWPDVLQHSMNSMNVVIFKYMWGGMYDTIINGTLQHINLMPHLHTITTPTLITCGVFDIARPETMAVAAQHMPHATLKIFDQSAHFPHLEQESKYIKGIEHFLTHDKKIRSAYDC